LGKAIDALISNVMPIEVISSGEENVSEVAMPVVLNAFESGHAKGFLMVFLTA